VLAGAGSEPEPVYAWMSESGDGSASLVYGSPETAEDLVFILTCRNEDKAAGLTVYVDIPDTEVADPVDIGLAAGEAKLTIGGAIDTDEMSGFHFAVAEDFKIKPLVALLKEKGEVTVTTGSVVTKLPEKGREKELANFAGACTLD
jgi:hypothetical protein